MRLTASSAVRPPVRLRVLLVVAIVLAATACSGGDDEVEATQGGGGSAGGAFPLTIEHAFGETEVEAEPKRVVSVGYTEQDTLLALGDAEPEVLTNSDGFQYEKIAALRPDLIIGTNAGIEEDTYDKLSEIAPTVAHPDGGEGYFSAWDVQALLIGKALGREDQAKELVDDVKGQFAEAAEAHPEWKGKKAIFLQNAFYEGEAIAYQEGLSTAFLTDLGFDVPPELEAFKGEEAGSQAFIPLEQLSVLDTADLLIWGTEKPEDRTALEAEPLYNALEEVRSGDLVFTDGLTAGAIYFTSVLSLPFVLEKLVPALEQVIDGTAPVTIGS